MLNFAVLNNTKKNKIMKNQIEKAVEKLYDNFKKADFWFNPKNMSHRIYKNSLNLTTGEVETILEAKQKIYKLRNDEFVLLEGYEIEFECPFNSDELNDVIKKSPQKVAHVLGGMFVAKYQNTSYSYQNGELKPNADGHTWYDYLSRKGRTTKPAI